MVLLMPSQLLLLSLQPYENYGQNLIKIVFLSLPPQPFSSLFDMYIGNINKKIDWKKKLNKYVNWVAVAKTVIALAIS